MGANKTSPDQYQLRFPPGLRDAIKFQADENSRSMNAEIIARLQASLESDQDQQAAAARVLDQVAMLQNINEFMSNAIGDALKELDRTGSLSKEHRKFIGDMLERWEQSFRSTRAKAYT